jgi:hypothetical protein
VDAELERSYRNRMAAEEHLARYLRQRYNADLAELNLKCRERGDYCEFYKGSAWRGQQVFGWIVGVRGNRWEIAEFGNGVGAAEALTQVRRLLG